MKWFLNSASQILMGDSGWYLNWSGRFSKYSIVLHCSIVHLRFWLLFLYFAVVSCNAGQYERCMGNLLFLLVFNQNLSMCAALCIQCRRVTHTPYTNTKWCLLEKGSSKYWSDCEQWKQTYFWGSFRVQGFELLPNSCRCLTFLCNTSFFSKKNANSW